MYSDRELYCYLVNAKKYQQFKILIDFYTLINDLSFKTKESVFLHIKLKWYTDALNFSPEHSIGVSQVDNLRTLLAEYNIPNTEFINLLQAKYVDLNLFNFTSIKDMLKYIKNTEYTILKNLAIINNQGKPLCQNTQQGLYYIALAYGLIGLVRNFTFFYKAKNLYTLFFNYNETFENFEENLANRSKQLIKLANLSMLKAKNIKTNNYSYKKFLLLNVFTNNYINAIQKANYNLFNADLHNVSKKHYLILLYKYLFRLK